MPVAVVPPTERGGTAAVGPFSTDWPMFMTVSVIALVPVVIFFIALQKHIVSGLVGGSIKG
jgi:raffinose/stachyose/melibiose transport system permease protein